MVVSADDIPQPDKGNLLACECSECVSVAYCGCQVFSERERNDSEDGFAYVEVWMSFFGNLLDGLPNNVFTTGLILI